MDWHLRFRLVGAAVTGTSEERPKDNSLAAFTLFSLSLLDTLPAMAKKYDLRINKLRKRQNDVYMRERETL